jgi:hypothetical protein
MILSAKTIFFEVVGLADPVDDRVRVCGVLARDGTAGHEQHIRTRHIGERRVNAQVH